VRIGVVADTHHPSYPIPASVLRAFASAELIVHAGDFCDVEALRAFESVAPVIGVTGNQDAEEVSVLMPRERQVDVDGRRLLVIHGDQGRTAVAAASAAAAAVDVDCVIFGHSHRAYQEYVGKVLLFNPGSPTWARFSKQRTFGFLETGPDLAAEIHEI